MTVISLPIGSGTTLSESGVTSDSTYQRTVSVYNGDFLIGFSYWFTPAFKLTVDYRLDAYFSPLRTFGANGSALLGSSVPGTVASLDRIYQGPEIALAAKF